jgi:hypothetical protein
VLPTLGPRDVSVVFKLESATINAMICDILVYVDVEVVTKSGKVPRGGKVVNGS